MSYDTMNVKADANVTIAATFVEVEVFMSTDDVPPSYDYSKSRPAFIAINSISAFRPHDVKEDVTVVSLGSSSDILHIAERCASFRERLASVPEIYFL